MSTFFDLLQIIISSVVENASQEPPPLAYITVGADGNGLRVFSLPEQLTRQRSGGKSYKE